MASKRPFSPAMQLLALPVGKAPLMLAGDYTYELFYF